MTGVRLVACKSCGATIFFGTMASGQQMPFDEAPSPSGAWFIQRYVGVVPFMHGVPANASFAGDLGDRFTTHFATCSNAAAHRTKRARRAPTTVPAR